MTHKPCPGYRVEHMPPVEKPDVAMQVRSVGCIRPYDHDGGCVFRAGETLNTLASSIHATNVAKGFWDSDRDVLIEKIALMHSELSEALEEHRAGRGPHWHTEDGKPEGVAVELVDCLIRILDTLAAMNMDVDALVAEKHAYNQTRPHMHGKAY